MAHDDNSSSSAFASFRSSVSKPFSEPAVDRSEKLASLLPLTLVAPEPRHAHRRAQFPGLCLLLTRDRERTLEIRFRFRRIRFRRLSSAISPAIRLTSASHHLSSGCFNSRHRFANAAPSVIELTEFRIRAGQR